MVERSPEVTARQLLQPAVERLGLELLELAWQGAPGRGVLRLTVDRPGGVTVEECGRASEVASLLLDRHPELFPGPYALEVSSPGAERELRREEDFTASLGRRVRLRLEAPEGEQVLEGRLLEVGPASLLLELRRPRSGRRLPQEVQRARVLEARVVVDI